MDRLQHADAQWGTAGRGRGSMAGFIPDFTSFNFGVGPATSQRGGIAAATRGSDLSDPNFPATLYTDCMALLNAIALWRRGDFQPR
eukprot:1057958-Rhodomonas_salina.4